jgi:serine/threonine protein phosphatase PrpC
MEASLPGIGAVTDKGKHHRRNEDAMGFVAAADRVSVIVCDGVGSSARADEASQAAVDAALPILEAKGVEGLAAAYDAARAAVCELEWAPSPGLTPPSCTYLAVIVNDSELTWTSMGDCRLYWVEDGAARQCTDDDSVASELVREGQLAAEDAPEHDGYHVVTRWLATDADPAWQPEVRTLAIGGPGRVVACSDGLWNYTLEPDALVAAMGEQTADALTAARRLTQFALTGGGHDNIAVVVVDVPLSGGVSPA